MSCVSGYAQNSQRNSPSTAQIEKLQKQVDELARTVEKQDREIQHLRTQSDLKDQRQAVTDEAVKLRDEKLVLVEENNENLKKQIAELKAAGTADKDTIDSLKKQVELQGKEIGRLNRTNWFQGKASTILILVAAFLGYVAGSR